MLSQLSYAPNRCRRPRPSDAARWARADLNSRPHAYQACALTKLSYEPLLALRGLFDDRRGLSGLSKTDSSPISIPGAKPFIVVEAPVSEDSGLERLKGSPAEAGGVWLLKEGIQPQAPLRLPCYDFTPITDQTVDGSLTRLGHRLQVQPTFVV